MSSSAFSTFSPLLSSSSVCSSSPASSASAFGSASSPLPFSASAVTSLIADQRSAFASTLEQLDSLISSLSASDSASFSSSDFFSHFSSFRSSSTNKFRDLYNRPVELSNSLQSITKPAVDRLDEFCSSFPPLRSLIVERLIYRSLLLQGEMAAAETLAQELNLTELEPSHPQLLDQFKEFHRIRGDLMLGHVESAMKWAKEIGQTRQTQDQNNNNNSNNSSNNSSNSNRGIQAENGHQNGDIEMGAADSNGLSCSLSSIGMAQELNDFLFDLHRIRFLQLLTQRDNTSSTAAAALAYAQSNFHAFPARMEEIRQLSTALLFPNSPEASTHSIQHFLSCVHQRFYALFCRSIDFPSVDPLWTAFLASEVSLPQIIRKAQILKQSNSASGGLLAAPNAAGMLEVDFGNNFQYHSTLVCPVTREPCDPSNPPVLLQCGHIISTNAMERIVKNLRMTRKFKCPTCPKEQLPSETRTVQL